MRPYLTLSVPNLRFPINAQPLPLPTSQLPIISRTCEPTLLILLEQTSLADLVPTIALPSPLDAKEGVLLAECTAELDCHLAEVRHGFC